MSIKIYLADNMGEATVEARLVKKHINKRYLQINLGNSYKIFHPP